MEKLAIIEEVRCLMCVCALWATRDAKQ